MSVILFSSHEQAVAARKAEASQEPRKTLGTTFTTPQSYFSDLWEVWGDGRAIVGRQERLMFALESLNAQDRFAKTLGTTRLVADFVQRYAGCPQLGEAMSHVDDFDLSDAERDLLDVAKDYYSALERRGFVELGSALELLAESAPRQDAAMPLPLELIPAARSFLECAGCSVPVMAEASVSHLPSGVAPRLIFPAGTTATTAAIYQELISFLSEASEGSSSTRACVAVCAPDPHELYEGLSPYLVSSRISCGLKCSVAFGETAFGRALRAVRTLEAGEAGWLSAATDFAFSAYAGMARADAQRINSRLRGDRLSGPDIAIELLGEASGTFGIFTRLVSLDDREALGLIAQFVEDAGVLNARQLPMERGAMEAYGRLMESIATWTPQGVRAVDLVDALSVSVSQRSDARGSDVQGGDAEGGDAGKLEVVFMPLLSVGGLPDKAYDEVVLADVTDAAWTGARRTALDELARKLGIDDGRETLGALRAAFATAQRAARKRFACVFPLRNAGQEETYAAFPFEEFVNCQARYAEGDTPSQPSQGGREEEVSQPLEVGTLRVPGVLASAMCLKGEDDLVSGVGATFAPSRESVSLNHPVRGKLSTLSLADHMRTVTEGDAALPVLSPSALEAYLGCPYKWFVERRVRLNEVDERFSALEKGSFAHAVYAAFYEALADEGYTRMPERADEQQAAYDLFDEVFDSCVAAQKSAGEGRLVAVSKAEALEIESMRPLLKSCLFRQAHLPQGFDVYGHEVVISPDDGLDYAGARLNGRADRVDVNEGSSRFVVLDYKGSVAGHAAGFEEGADAGNIELPRKVQALVYAQAFRRKFEGLSCAGALYLAYRARSDGDFAAGSFDESAYDMGRYAKDSSCVHMNFDRFLDVVEQTIEPSVRSLLSGDIKPRPRDKKACEFCPVSSCEGRL